MIKYRGRLIFKAMGWYIVHSPKRMGNSYLGKTYNECKAVIDFMTNRNFAKRRK